MKKSFLLFLTLPLLFSCSSGTKKNEKETVILPKEELITEIEYEIVGRIPHDTNSFTEGLLFHNNNLFESTGSPENLPQTKSIFGIIDTFSGKIIAKAELGKKYFGEGIVILNDKVFQLTYKNQIGFIYDAKTFKLIGEFSYKNKEGWGMTTDGTNLIISDGTNNLTYLDPNTFKEIKSVSIKNAGYAEDNLNELEFIKGYIYANIWTKNYVVKIDTATGKVVGTINFAALTDEVKRKNSNSEVLNGLAYDTKTDKLYVTGKLFPYIFEIKLKE